MRKRMLTTGLRELGKRRIFGRKGSEPGENFWFRKKFRNKILQDKRKNKFKKRKTEWLLKSLEIAKKDTSKNYKIKFKNLRKDFLSSYAESAKQSYLTLLPVNKGKKLRKWEKSNH